jgi:hypothetical protein
LLEVVIDPVCPTEPEVYLVSTGINSTLIEIDTRFLGGHRASLRGVSYPRIHGDDS